MTFEVLRALNSPIETHLPKGAFSSSDLVSPSQGDYLVKSGTRDTKADTVRQRVIESQVDVCTQIDAKRIPRPDVSQGLQEAMLNKDFHGPPLQIHRGWQIDDFGSLT